MRVIQQVFHERDQMRRSEQMREEAIAHFEQELAKAIETLDMEVKGKMCCCR